MRALKLNVHINNPLILGSIMDFYGFNIGIDVLSTVIPLSIPIFLQIKKKDASTEDK